MSSYSNAALLLTINAASFVLAMPFGHYVENLDKVEFSAVLNIEPRESTTIVKHQKSSGASIAGKWCLLTNWKVSLYYSQDFHCLYNLERFLSNISPEKLGKDLRVSRLHHMYQPDPFKFISFSAKKKGYYLVCTARFFTAVDKNRGYGYLVVQVILHLRDI